MLRRGYNGGGKHTEEVLFAFGYSKEEIEDLRRECVV
jgi:crotonobetainyl-CoA:carnitine CoA-transferase CaiB-like acyl-CoA transferase